MTTEKDEANWAAEIGRPTAANLREMVAALECDYDELAELREERDSFAPDDVSEDAEPDAAEAVAWAAVWATEYPDDAERLRGLEAASNPCGNPCKDDDDAERMIQEDPLSVEVRSDWVSVGEKMTAGEYRILLSTGGPATCIEGGLDQHGEPSSARLLVQDWGKPWTEYHEPELSDVLLTYARCFCFGS